MTSILLFFVIMLRKTPFLAIYFLTLTLLGVGSQATVRAQPFFISGYGDGLYVSTLNGDGAMTPAVLIAEQANASFFCFHPTLDVIYAVTETMRKDPKNPAMVVAYRAEKKTYLTGKTPKLSKLNSQPVDGDIPCHVVVDETGKHIIIANYTNGSVVVYPLAADGSIEKESCNIVHEIVPGKKKSNAHCSAVAPGNRWVLVADLGLDRVFVYELDQLSGKLKPGPHPYLELPTGAGPRHLSFHPTGKYVYIINETNMTMTAATWEPKDGKLTTINHESTLPAGTNTDRMSTAEVLVHPNGRFVYGSNRGHDSIVCMAIDLRTGAIKRAENYPTLGKTPRNFRLAPFGQFLLAENQGSDSVFSFKVNGGTGSLEPTGQSIQVKAPACIRFLTEQSTMKK
jgi:6-phosphogluconolactonase